MLNSLEILQDILDHIPTFSYLQIGLFFLVVFLMYFIEHLTYYNSLLYAPVAFPGFPSPTSPPPTSSTSTSTSTKKNKKNK